MTTIEQSVDVHAPVRRTDNRGQETGGWRGEVQAPPQTDQPGQS